MTFNLDTDYSYYGPDISMLIEKGKEICCKNMILLSNAKSSVQQETNDEFTLRLAALFKRGCTKDDLVSLVLSTASI